MRFGLGSIVGRMSVVVLVAATVVAVASPSSADAGDPIGAFDAAQIHLPYYAPNEWNLYGWAADPDAPGAQVTVHLYVDGVGVTNSYPTPPYLDGAYPVATGDPRPDVAAAFPFAGQNSGWKTQLTLPDTGEHTVCAYALNVGAGSQNTTLGCITLTPNAPGNPIGNLDALTPAQGLIRFQGWAGDPNPNPDPFPLRVRVYEDGLQAYSFPADLPRPDAQNAFPALAGVGGFDFTAPARPGQHIYCEDIGNVGPGGANTSLGCALVGVPGPQPPGPNDTHGAWDTFTFTSAASEPAHYDLSGWAWDPKTSAPYQVRIRTLHPNVTGLEHTPEVLDITTGQPRRDVQQAFPDAPQDTGWSYQYGINPNDAISLMCVYALDGPSERLLDCKRR